MKKTIFKSKKFKVISIILFMYLLFAAIVLINFYSTKNDPLDKIAMPYIWQNEDLKNQYGDISSVFRYIGNEVKKNEMRIKVPYSVKTEKYRIIVYITLEKNEENWEAESLEILEVIENVS